MHEPNREDLQQIEAIEQLRNMAQEGNDQFQKEIFRGCEVLIATDGKVKDQLNKIAQI